MPGWRVPRSGRILQAMLAAQIALAGLIVFGDFRRIAPDLWRANSTPPAAVPVRPGDQTRRYAPRDLPRDQPAGPGFPRSDEVPQRLQFTETQVSGLKTVLLEGAIEPGDSARLAQYLDQRRSAPEQIALHSPGGSVTDALEIGRMIRAGGWPTVMQAGAACFSSCPYILAAGTDRRVSRTALVGVHQHYFGENTLLPAFLAVESIQHGQGEVLDYLDSMGIDLRLSAKAMQTPPANIYILVEEELTGFALATEMVE
ncbi:MAG: hypothetical protein U0934_10765 [Pseudotabrizicola sp.]|uniref:COG3904 family protein n=1 Tax=Pseudotabrizicola sp. TaxID=2939647 RepID=UPI00272FAA2A|nr:hypothetical protein [Pseudotabrizicola sp.]MDP2082890.1 hypothetical protein [Pseudotabrizicola sp.]MDZ7574422.1 hypothetical protein [Pseudotabrizicola sp.]